MLLLMVSGVLYLVFHRSDGVISLTLPHVSSHERLLCDYLMCSTCVLFPQYATPVFHHQSVPLLSFVLHFRLSLIRTVTFYLSNLDILCLSLLLFKTLASRFSESEKYSTNHPFGGLQCSTMSSLSSLHVVSGSGWSWSCLVGDTRQLCFNIPACVSFFSISPDGTDAQCVFVT